VGLLSLQNDAYRDARPFPLDVLGAETQGMIGYEIEAALRSAIPEREVATVVTTVEIDLSDRAFSAPSKPVGPLYSRVRARRLAGQHQWAIGPDGPGFRRLVASPEPVRILELSPIRRLVEAGFVVICAGGGGVPVAVDASGVVSGIEAVIDKDLVSTQLAIELAADALLLLTDVEAAFVDWGTPSARPIRRAGPNPLRRLEFASGTMGPKVEAACRFVEEGGRFAAIGALSDAEAVLRGDAQLDARERSSR
jgi:carbamate kinase